MTETSSATPWRSIYLSTVLQVVIGVQFGIYLIITWPYFTEIDSTASAHFLGLIIASSSLGCAIFNPIFGMWTQKTMSTRYPVTVGFALALVGHAFYFLAPNFGEHARYVLLVSRFIMGCGSGCVTSLRSYVATASTAGDRLKAVTYSSAGYSAGTLVGPAIASLFTLIPVDANWAGMHLNKYSITSVFMMVCCAGSIILMNTIFEERHAGMLSEEEKEDVTLPKADKPALLICCLCNFIVLGVEMGLEGTMSPITMSLYDWSAEAAVRYNGLLIVGSCSSDLLSYVALSQTRASKIDRRKQLFFGVCMIALYYLLQFPWPFYGALVDHRYDNSTGYSGAGCYDRYDWCSSTYRQPLWLFAVMMIGPLSLGYCWIVATANTLLSEVLGPRKQGMWQGAMTFAGSMGQLIFPIFMSSLFDTTGMVWISVIPFSMCIGSLVLILLCWRRLVPLSVPRQLDQIAPAH